MTDRIQALTVVLDRDIREDDVQQLVEAVRMLRNVADVMPVIVTGTDQMNRAILRERLQARLHEAIIAAFAEPTS